MVPEVVEDPLGGVNPALGENIGFHVHEISGVRSERSPSSRTGQQNSAVDYGHGPYERREVVRENPDGNSRGCQGADFGRKVPDRLRRDEDPNGEPPPTRLPQGAKEAIGMRQAKKQKIRLMAGGKYLFGKESPGEGSPADGPVPLGAHPDAHAED